MAQTVTPAVLVPRFTTFVGEQSFFTLPIDVSAFQKGYISVWHGDMLGTNTPKTLFNFLESTDRVIWSSISGASAIDPGPGIEEQVEFDISKRWLQLSVELKGTNPATTCWVAGYFRNREE